jgi:hypothetical protein
LTGFFAQETEEIRKVKASTKERQTERQEERAILQKHENEEKACKIHDSGIDSGNEKSKKIFNFNNIS